MRRSGWKKLSKCCDVDRDTDTAEEENGSIYVRIGSRVAGWVSDPEPMRSAKRDRTQADPSSSDHERVLG